MREGMRGWGKGGESKDFRSCSFGKKQRLENIELKNIRLFFFLKKEIAFFNQLLRTKQFKTFWSINKTHWIVRQEPNLFKDFQRQERQFSPFESLEGIRKWQFTSSKDCLVLNLNPTVQLAHTFDKPNCPTGTHLWRAVQLLARNIMWVFIY